MQIRDTVAVTDYALTGEGYLHVRAVLSRTGIQEYAGYEVGRDDDATYRVYRDAADVFEPGALDSFGFKPVTDGHPFDGVTASNWRKEAVGLTMPGARQDGDHVAGALMISDAEVINRVQREDRVELSCGYDCTLLWESGVTPTGEVYDARQTQIRINHVAIVERGRCGPSCAIAADGATPTKVTDCSGRCTCTRTPQPTKGQSDMTTKTVTIGGQSFEVPANVADAIQAEQAIAAKTTSNLDALMERTEAVLGTIADKTKTTDAELAAKDAEIDALKAKVLTPDQLNAALDARTKLIADAHSIAPEVETVGKSADEIRQAALVACLGDRATTLDGKSPAYIEAAFDARVENAGERIDPTVVAVARGTTNADGASPDKAREAHMAAMADAWKATA